ncbi:flagellar hook-associated protein FlgK [Noviherbaspirillum sp. 1P10PC]|uniref:flagellar hook-associated protein FlgK n=1 Tax=Noviherbaspirillum sp. 1P10PC TaxID=3132292 RepID=UPI0039A3C5A3
MSSILSVGQSALSAAQAGLVTTGHNIANASTPGYNRQVVVQGAVNGQDAGYGFIGKGTEVTAVRRVYSEFLNTQVLSTQTASTQLSSYYGQIQQVNNMLADSKAGLTPVLQDFFSSLQAAGADPSSGAARESMLSSANTLVGRFQSMDAQLGEVRQGVTTEMRSSVDAINVYAQQIGKLNDAIEKATSNGGSTPNDLLDQRDQAISELSKEIKVSVVKQGATYNVMIGSGQPLVVGTKTYDLSMAQSPTDPKRPMVAYQTVNGTVLLSDESLSGGKLGGLLEFRSKTLDQAQNALGRIAITLASSFNAQHVLGQDANGNPGVEFFKVAEPVVSPSSRNGDQAASASAAIVNPSALTTSDYKVQVTAAGTPPGYKVVRLSDGKPFDGPADGSSMVLDGVSFGVSGPLTAGDEFLVRPTADGASLRNGINVKITDKATIALGSPLASAAASGNSGTGSISAPTVTAAGADLTQPVAITFTSANTFDVTGTGPGLPAIGVAFKAGEDISYNGWKLQISGVPASGDSFTVGGGSNGSGDNRNALALAALQSASTTDGASTSFQGAYSQLVSQVGNKTRELASTSAAAEQLRASAVSSQQAESGVNLDEEAANLLRYQQAYQAAGKVMKTASDMFDVLLSLGR